MVANQSLYNNLIDGGADYRCLSLIASGHSPLDTAFTPRHSRGAVCTKQSQRFELLMRVSDRHVTSCDWSKQTVLTVLESWPSAWSRVTKTGHHLIETQTMGVNVGRYWQKTIIKTIACTFYETKEVAKLGPSALLQIGLGKIRL